MLEQRFKFDIQPSKSFVVWLILLKQN